MAEAGILITLDQFNCPVCLDLLKDPVTTPCGHNFCTFCINRFWDDEVQKRIFSCPQCRETFTPRPGLRRNNILAEVVEKLKAKELKEASVHGYAGPGDVECDSCIGRKRKAVNSCLVCQAAYCQDHLQPHYQSPAFKRHKLVEACAELQEMTDECIIHNTGANKPRSPSLSCVSSGCNSITFNQDVSSVGGTKSLPDIKTQDGKTCQEDLNKKHPQAEGVQMIFPSDLMSRKYFLKYFRYLTLDPNTAHRQLILSENDRAVTHSITEQRYPEHPERFDSRPQVLCSQSVGGRCYWEVEWRGGVSISVSYKEISRKGGGNKCGFGYNRQSWSLQCSTSSVSFWHNDIKTELSGPASSRIGVLVEYSAGTLSFYSISDTIRLHHKVHTTFTQPLYAGFRIWYNSSVRLI